ncbi:MAG: Fpg/Nei family DNA glycosylase [Actinobacteria bacterium]|nr:Fpg/Nei family DNA glycosylase [Actinomycetota bacterium]
MPEGDTIHRTAAALRTALVGRPVTRFIAPRLYGPTPTAGRVIEHVESHGKHLEILWDDGLVLHTHMRMSGSWHLYRVGERWRKSDNQMRVVIEVPEWVAVCFNAPVVETYREFDIHRHPGFGKLGPDLCTAPVRDLELCARRIYEYPDRDAVIADVLLDQHVACGVGNVYRSEILWSCAISPFAPVSSLEPSDCVQIINAATRMLRANLSHGPRITNRDIPGGLAVYSRNGQRCVRCTDTVHVKRLGEHARLVYWCPGCQTRLAPQRDITPPSLEMDPHPAAAKYLSELPWRRDIAG